MLTSKVNRAVAILTAAMQLLISSLAILPSHVFAQSNDFDAPVITLVVVDEGVRGETQVFSATITDATSVASATLHYRLGSDGAFNSAPMSNIQSTDIYTASVDTSQTIASVVQYYIEARDESGNRAVEGFAFDPFDRVLTDESLVVAAPDVPPPPAPMSTSRKIIYGVLGLVAIGVLAGSAGGSSSSGGSTGATGPNIPLTITVDPL